MAFEDALNSMNISAAGASAERLRMEVVANNIANAYSTRTPRGTVPTPGCRFRGGL